MWDNIEDTGERKGTGELIKELKGKLGIYNEVLSDESGEFAIIKDKIGIFVAKTYIWGNIVSCHKRAVFSALNLQIPLIMYIEKTGRFYKFDPEEILKSGEENTKGDAKMLNFNITFGKRWDLK